MENWDDLPYILYYIIQLYSYWNVYASGFYKNTCGAMSVLLFSSFKRWSAYPDLFCLQNVCIMIENVCAFGWIWYWAISVQNSKSSLHYPTDRKETILNKVFRWSVQIFTEFWMTFFLLFKGVFMPLAFLMYNNWY